MKLSHTTIQVYRDGQRFALPPGMHAGVSLHSHSECSRETLDFVPGVARRIPLIAALYARSVAHYERQHGRRLDFGSIYWRPPLPPAAVIASERRQIQERFDCDALVALTDHDTLEGPRKLRSIGTHETPFSFEWSVTVAETILHLGVHGIPAEKVDEAEQALTSFTGGRSDSTLAELLDWLVESPGTFIVLNHPCWDLQGVGALRHEAIVLAFLRAHRQWIHALELNGYRRWSENRRVLPLAEGFALPVVTGGDRHGCAPNAMINASGARSFAEFARDLRARRPTCCVVFPEYFDPFAARILEGARDALGPHPDLLSRVWCERVFWTTDGIETSLASLWPWGGPWWLRRLVDVTRLLGSRSMRPLFRATLTSEPGTLL